MDVPKQISPPVEDVTDILRGEDVTCIFNTGDIFGTDIDMTVIRLLNVYVYHEHSLIVLQRFQEGNPGEIVISGVGSEIATVKITDTNTSSAQTGFYNYMLEFENGGEIAKHEAKLLRIIKAIDE